MLWGNLSSNRDHPYEGGSGPPGSERGTQTPALTLEQRRQVQLLNLMFIYTLRHEDVRRLHARNTRAANTYSFTRELYHNNKYKNSPFYKAALLGDKLHVDIRKCDGLKEFKRALKRVYCQ